MTCLPGSRMAEVFPIAGPKAKRFGYRSGGWTNEAGGIDRRSAMAPGGTCRIRLSCLRLGWQRGGARKPQRSAKALRGRRLEDGGRLDQEARRPRRATPVRPVIEIPGAQGTGS